MSRVSVGQLKALCDQQRMLVVQSTTRVNTMAGESLSGLFCEETDIIGDGFLAGFAERGYLVASHPAVGIGPVNPVESIARAFKEARVGNVFPLSAKVYTRCDVALPGFHILRVHGHLLIVVGIFVGESTKTVTELMHHHFFRIFVVDGGEQIFAIDTAPP